MWGRISPSSIPQQVQSIFYPSDTLIIQWIGFIRFGFSFRDSAIFFFFQTLPIFISSPDFFSSTFSTSVSFSSLHIFKEIKTPAAEYIISIESFFPSHPRLPAPDERVLCSRSCTQWPVAHPGTKEFLSISRFSGTARRKLYAPSRCGSKKCDQQHIYFLKSILQKMSTLFSESFTPNPFRSQLGEKSSYQ